MTMTLRAARAGLLLLAALLLPGSSSRWMPQARADALADLDAALEEVAERADLAAAGVLENDRATVAEAIDATGQAAIAAYAAVEDPAVKAVLGKKQKSVRTRIDRVLTLVALARTLARDRAAGSAAVAARIGSLVRTAGAARGGIPADAATGFVLSVKGGSGFLKPGGSLELRVVPATGGPGVPCGNFPALSVMEEGPAAAVAGGVEDLGDGRYRLVLGPGPGSARVVVQGCGATREIRVLNRGPKGTLSKKPGWGESGSAPEILAYGLTEISCRVGAPIVSMVPTVSGAMPARYEFTADPPLPAGVTLDAVTGEIAGSPTSPQAGTDHAVTVSNVHGETTFHISFEVTPALPPGVEWLQDGFVIDAVQGGLSVPVKMAFAPDGRLFFNELATGNIRVVGADGVLRATPFATVGIHAEAEQGLLGLALAPDFPSSGHLFVYAIVEAAGPKPVRGQVIRFTASGDAGGAPVVVVDDLPTNLTLNGGDLQFGQDGMLYLSVGDTGDSSLAQQEGALAGRILRFAPDGSVPADNPIPASPEWVRGLRNSFDMAFQPGTGGLFASENGPTFGDEVNFIQRGRNYAWETLPPNFPLNQVGARVTSWTPVIAPTGIAFHSGTGFGSAYADNLFLLSYDLAEMRRLVLSGPAFTDLDYQVPFARWDDSGSVDQKPLDVVEGPGGGDLFVSTFTTIWRIRRF